MKKNILISIDSCKVVWEYQEISVFSHASEFVKIPSLPFPLFSEALCTLCPDWPVYAALLSDRWCVYKLISCSCLTLWLASANNIVSASDTVSRLKLKLRRPSLLRNCNVPCNHFVSVQSNHKRNKMRATAKTGRGGCSRFAIQRVSYYRQR